MSRIVSRPFSTVDCVATHFPVADLNWEMVDALGTWLGAFLTISLLAVTLFQVGLLDWRFGPRLELVWENLEPTFQAIESWEETTPQDMSFQIRGKVVNTGLRPARDVTVFLKSVRSPTGASVDYRHSDFVPGRLKWTHLACPQFGFIAPDSFALCDIAYTRHNGLEITEISKMLERDLNQGRPLSPCEINLCIEATPKNGGSVFGAGCYQFEFEIIDVSGVCGAGELRMEVGASYPETKYEKPPVKIQITHDRNFRWCRS
jgi:hypothetical protein